MLDRIKKYKNLLCDICNDIGNSYVGSNDVEYKLKCSKVTPCLTTKNAMSLHKRDYA